MEKCLRKTAGSEDKVLVLEIWKTVGIETVMQYSIHLQDYNTIHKINIRFKFKIVFVFKNLVQQNLFPLS